MYRRRGRYQCRRDIGSSDKPYEGAALKQYDAFMTDSIDNVKANIQDNEFPVPPDSIDNVKAKIQDNEFPVLSDSIDNVKAKLQDKDSLVLSGSIVEDTARKQFDTFMTVSKVHEVATDVARCESKTSAAEVIAMKQFDTFMTGPKVVDVATSVSIVHNPTRNQGPRWADFDPAELDLVGHCRDMVGD